MWLRGRGERWRRRLAFERRWDAKLSPQDEQRINEIRQSFEEKGWRLFVGHEERDVWVAWFYDEGLGPTLNDLVRRRTAVGAALAAWESFGRERHAGGQAELGVPEA